MTVIDITLRDQENKYYPCSSCNSGWDSQSSWTDKETGHLMVENKSCTDAGECERYSVWKQYPQGLLEHERI